MNEGLGELMCRRHFFMEIAMIKHKCSHILSKQEQSVAKRLQNKDEGQP